MTQRQKTPSTGSGKPTSAEDLAGNKVAEMMGDKAAKALEAIDKAVKAQAAVPKPKRRREVICDICHEPGCPYGYWEDY